MFCVCTDSLGRASYVRLVETIIQFLPHLKTYFYYLAYPPWRTSPSGGNFTLLSIPRVTRHHTLMRPELGFQAFRRHICYLVLLLLFVLVIIAIVSVIIIIIIS